MTKSTTPKPDRGDAAQAAYETAEPAGQPGRYPFPVDLNAKTSTEMRRTNEGVAQK